MKKIQDRIILGLLSGIVATFPSKLLNAIEYKTKLTDLRYDQLASTLFIPSNKKNTIEGKIIGSLTNNILTGITGVLITYLLSITGRDNASIKGLGVTTSLWIGIYGIIPRLGLTIRSKKPFSTILSFIDHAIFGALCGVISSKLGNDSLFPDVKLRQNEKLPLVSFPNQSDNSLKLKRQRKKHNCY